MKIDKATLLHVDCMEFMAGLPDKAFDLAIVDPPYGLGKRLCRGGMQNQVGRMSGSEYKGKEWDVVPSSEYFSELNRVSKNQIIWGGNYFSLPATRCFVIWDKHQPLETYSFGELAWTSFDGPATKFDFPYTNYVEGSGHPEKRIHPTQKPVKLYEWLLTNYAKPGQRILDTHLGSGSSAIACNNLGYEMVGCELDTDYYQAACKRVEQASKQIRMFA